MKFKKKSIFQVGPYTKLINLVKNFPRNIFAEIFDLSNPSPCFQNRLSYVTLKTKLVIKSHSKMLMFQTCFNFIIP